MSEDMEEFEESLESSAETEEEQEGTYLWGIEIADLDSWIHPVDCLIIVKGINVENGGPTMTAIGSAGLTPWEALGMMQIETARIKGRILRAFEMAEDEDELEYEDDIDPETD